MRAVAAIYRFRRLPDVAHAMQAHASFPGRFGGAVAPAATDSLHMFRPTNSAGLTIGAAWNRSHR
jgi:hypothetical protein